MIFIDVLIITFVIILSFINATRKGKLGQWIIGIIIGLIFVAFRFKTNEHFLPRNFEVDAGPNHSVINHPAPGYVRTALRTVHQYEGEDGCYIAVYSHDKNGSAYSVADDIYVMGGIWVQGHYQGRVCRPKGYENQDISASPTLKGLTNQYFPGYRGGTWPGGDTGWWFGIQ
jgi:hypothetical protein